MPLKLCEKKKEKEKESIYCKGTRIFMILNVFVASVIYSIIVGEKETTGGIIS